MWGEKKRFNTVLPNILLFLWVAAGFSSFPGTEAHCCRRATSSFSLCSWPFLDNCRLQELVYLFVGYLASVVYIYLLVYPLPTFLYKPSLFAYPPSFYPNGPVTSVCLFFIMTLISLDGFLFTKGPKWLKTERLI